MSNIILPWHDDLWQQMMLRLQQNRLPHALLFCGVPGLGKSLFAERLAKFLLCENSQINHKTMMQACGHCKACNLLQARTHPDLIEVKPTEVGKQISIQQIRELIQLCILTSSYGGYQIIIVQPAEAMNRNAANSLLKLLEEPSKNTLIMLISHQPMVLLATIRSRCQHINFANPNKNIVATWLQKQLKTIDSHYDAQLLLNLSIQAPLTALELAKTDNLQKRELLFNQLVELLNNQIDPVQIAEQWKKENAEQILYWMLTLTMDLIRYGTTEQIQYVTNYDYQNKLQYIILQCKIQNLFFLLDLQTEAYRLIKNTNVNTHNVLESMAINWFNLKTLRGQLL
ncbi:MAG: DNA polymerase III subunit delta' [Thiomargarita sp.]|nr:DNA polymerase III subunit delta' [Thiomargarita sp.]